MGLITLRLGRRDLHPAPFLSLRTDLGRGDLCCLYLDWLSGLQSASEGRKICATPTQQDLPI